MEPTYVAGVTPPTALLGAFGIDQFRQCHLAPPWYMEKEHICRLFTWYPITMPAVTDIVSDLHHILRKATP